MEKSQNPSQNKALNWLLLLAAAAGLSVAFFEAVTLKKIPPNNIASVNNVSISRSDYNHALLVLSRVRRAQISPADKEHILNVMIDNELLYQRAIELGLARSHAEIRRTLVQAMVNFALENSTNQTPSDDELRKFYQKNKKWFELGERLLVRRIYVSLDKPRKAEKIAAALKNGAKFEKLIAESDDAIEVPVRLLPIETLYQYLGAQLALVSQKLQIGKPSEMITTASGFYFLLVKARKPSSIPKFDKIKKEVARRYQTSQDEKALLDYVKNLRSRAKIKIAK